MKRCIKQILSLFIAILMLFGVVSVAVAADDYDYPVIVINGIDHNPLYENPNTASANQIFPPSGETLVTFAESMYMKGISKLASSEFDDEVISSFENSLLFEILEKIQFNSDGTSKKSNIGHNKYEYNLSTYRPNIVMYEKIAGKIGLGIADRLGDSSVYVFTYDWRIDPIENARNLNEFVQHVKNMSGKEKVSIISEGYGSTIAVTYLAECYNDATADIDNFVTVNSAFMGTSLIGDIYTGRFAVSFVPPSLRDTTSAFVRYMNYASNISTPNIIDHFILTKQWELQDLMTKSISMLAGCIDTLYDNYLRDILKYLPGLWALVPVDYYNEAMEWMFADDSAEYNGELNKRIQTFKNYQSSVSEILKNAKNKGVNINVVSSWDVQLVPIGDNKASSDYGVNNITPMIGLAAQSDGLIDTYYSSFGAYTVAHGDVFEAITNDAQRYTEGECEDHYHMNAVYDSIDGTVEKGGIAHYIDASTCALPDNTWFIRNMIHGTFEKESNSMDFLVYLTTCDATIDVFAAVNLYSQFMSYNRYIQPGYLDIPEDEPLLTGDIDGDGYVTSADARLVLRVTAGLEYADNKTVMDIDGDGKVMATDARRLLRVSAMIDEIENFAPARTSLDCERSESVAVEMTVAGDDTVIDVGETIDVTVSAKNVTGLQNGNLFFSYNSEYLEFVSAKQSNNYVLDGIIAIDDCISDENVGLGFSTMEVCSLTDVDIAVITFTAKKSGESLLNCSVGTWDGTEVPADCSISIDIHEHDYSAVVINPTCTEQGYTTYTCLCGDSYVADYTDATGHTFGKWVVVTAPTVNAEGMEERACTVCGEKETRTIEKISYIIGDVNGDNDITAADARQILRKSAGLE
ncbi:MAG: hypothetical protein IJZ35_02910 [Clostridia bacterium]|nr:hypothetical protein [Clostridia bacterium]